MLFSVRGSHSTIPYCRLLSDIYLCKLIKGLIFIVLLLLSSASYAQSKKLSKDESARMTQDQRLVHETSRKSKQGKKKVSTKKKAKISKKQDRRARRMKQPK